MAEGQKGSFYRRRNQEDSMSQEAEHTIALVACKCPLLEVTLWPVALTPSAVGSHSTYGDVGLSLPVPVTSRPQVGLNSTRLEVRRPPQQSRGGGNKYLYRPYIILIKR